MNIELTTACPLHCPQCYCSLQGGKHIPLKRAVFWLNEGAAAGVKSVALSGGESMCYPYLNEVIGEACRVGINAYVATSGFGLTQNSLQGMIDAGVSGIYLSLNGSSEKVNRITRDGYDYAINGLRLLNDNSYNHVTINWVMHANNVEDFPFMVELAEKYSVERIVIIGFKPDANHEMSKIPSFTQMKWLHDYLVTLRSNVQVIIEPCYSPFRAFSMETKLLGNLNIGTNKGCRAGLCSFSINVDGKLTPCRHIDLPEDFGSLNDYWNNSEVLSSIRKARKEYKEPCKSCKYSKYCIHCLAINLKLHNELSFGYKECPIVAKQE